MRGMWVWWCMTQQALICCDYTQCTRESPLKVHIGVLRHDKSISCDYTQCTRERQLKVHIGVLRHICIDAEHATRLDSQGAKPWHVCIEHDREWHARQQFQAATAHHRHSGSPSSLLAHHGGGSSRPEDKGEKG